MFFRTLVFLTTVIIVSAQCPHSCDCTKEFIANCTNLDLRYFPFGKFGNKLYKLDVSFNKIKTIEELTIRRRYITSLKQLNVSNNIVETIHRKSFIGQGTLQEIDLSRNNIRTLYPDTFKYPPNLIWLSLRGNKNLQIVILFKFQFHFSLNSKISKNYICHIIN